MSKSNRLFLFSREKQLIALLGELGPSVSRTDFQKLLFLYCSNRQRSSTNESVTATYEFVPYKYGAFSFTSHHDRKRLEAKGIVDGTTDGWALTTLGKKIAKHLRTDEIICFVKQYDKVRGDRLIAETYRENPFTATKSQILDRVLKQDQITKRRVRTAIPTTSNLRLFTIGYQQRTLEGFINLLLLNSVETLCDVRHNPLSRRYGFSKNTLKIACSNIGIEYLHLPQLGIESKQRKNLKSDTSFRRIFTHYKNTTLPSVTQTIKRIRTNVLEGRQMALTCYERLPQQCHRSILADALLESSYDARNSPRSSSRTTIETMVSIKHL